jgi:hypothetical protein
LDKFVRNIINDLGGVSSLSDDLFYTASKNGGLGLKNLSERYLTCKYNRMAHFFHINEETKDFIK